jgi:glycosyltransferase involved in cell wall biosynthesis
MQEIVPLIEKQWSFDESEVTSSVVNCDNIKLKDLTAHLLKANLIVFTVFNAAIARVAQYTRNHLNLDTPWVVYLHGQATLGMWPYSHFKMSDLFLEQDLFVGTCKGDKEALQLSFPKAKYFNSTFSYTPLPEGEELSLKEDKHSFYYIGRISPQKQLHQLLFAFSIFIKENGSDFSLHLFGGEDDLGSPNMGIKGEGYLDFLKDLKLELKLEKVFFHGFKKREDIHTTIKKSKNFTAVYPSLHSDENFGMSLMRVLCDGGTAIATSWGGFKEHLSEFPNACIPLPVNKGSYGPSIQVTDLVEAMKGSASLKGQKIMPARYLLDTERLRIFNLIVSLNKSSSTQIKLAPSSFHKKLLSRKQNFMANDPQKVFTGYNDKMVQQLFNAYGMIEKQLECPKKIEAAPWLLKVKEGYQSDEPHKGKADFEDSQEAFSNGHFVIKKV